MKQRRIYFAAVQFFFRFAPAGAVPSFSKPLSPNIRQNSAVRVPPPLWPSPPSRLPWLRGACAVTRCTRRKAAAAATTIRALTAAIATTAAPASCAAGRAVRFCLQPASRHTLPLRLSCNPVLSPPAGARGGCPRLPASSAAHPVRSDCCGDEALPKGGPRRGRGVGRLAPAIW